MRLTSETNRGQFPSEAGCLEAALAKLITSHDKVVEAGREPESSLDRLSRFALFDPNFMRFAYIIVGPHLIGVDMLLMPATRFNFDTAFAPNVANPMATAFF